MEWIDCWNHLLTPKKLRGGVCELRCIFCGNLLMQETLGSISFPFRRSGRDLILFLSCLYFPSFEISLSQKLKSRPNFALHPELSRKALLITYLGNFLAGVARKAGRLGIRESLREAHKVMPVCLAQDGALAIKRLLGTSPSKGDAAAASAYAERTVKRFAAPGRNPIGMKVQSADLCRMTNFLSFHC